MTCEQEPIPPLKEQLTHLLEEFRKQTGVPGIGLVLRTGGHRIAVATGVRSADAPGALAEGAQFHIGCVAKLLASLVALELARCGELDLNAPIDEYLPEIRSTVHGETVALVHLLSHTSGYQGTELLERESREFTWERFVEYLAGAPQFFVPGTVFNYEHTGAVLVGEIVRRVTGADVLDLTREMILAPLGITPGKLHGDQGSAPPQVGQHVFDIRRGRYVKTGWSAFYQGLQLPFPMFWRSAFSVDMMSLDDIAALGVALCGGFADSHSCISPANWSQIQRSVVQVPPVAGGPMAELHPSAFTLGAAEYRSGWLGIGGISVGQCVGLRFQPAHQISVAVGINATAPYLSALLLELVCGIVGGEDLEPRRPRFEFDLRELTGKYRGRGRQECDVRLEDECLVCRFGTLGSAHQQSAELVIGDDQCAVVRSPEPTMALGFFREPANGTEVAMMLGLTAFKRITNETL